MTRPNAARSGRSASLVSSIMAAALVIAVVAVAYGTRAPQLGVAEFSPSARNVLDAPPPTDASGASRGASAARRRNTTTSTTAMATTAPISPESGQAATRTTLVGRSRRCYGDPPRQTEDPMSPPCVATVYEGDNGGSTGQGITGTEIRVGIAGLSPSTTSDYNRTVDALFNYFNANYEFYGRKLVPVYDSSPIGGAIQGRAMAANLAAKNIFAAATGFYEWYIGHSSLPAELARNGIITVVRGATTWWSDRTLYDLYHPYVWSAFPSAEDIQTNLASFSCAALAGKPAANAGDADLRGKARHFGIVAEGKESPPPTGVLAQLLSECEGREPSKVGLLQNATAADRTTALTRLKSDGATTLFCVCEGYGSEDIYRAANQANFHPEWVLSQVSTQAGNDEGAVQSTRVNDKMAPPIRVNAGPRLIPTQARPYYAAIQDVLKPGTFLYGEIAQAEFFYPALLTLAAGIQGAGPHLTPDAFAAALMTMQFPNPGAGQPPYYQPSVGFGPGDHSLFDDYHVGWWSDTAEALDLVAGSTSTGGSWCYLDHAARFRPGTYPASALDRMFKPDIPCR